LRREVRIDATIQVFGNGIVFERHRHGRGALPHRDEILDVE
jgi:hypothetical protein